MSIKNVKYPFDNIPLVISIDGGGDKEVLAIAESFSWTIGKKVIITHDENLGLRNHILKCGDLTCVYNSIIMLEEDCFVSKDYYNYANSALKFYNCDENIAGISLYSYSFNENAGLPFYAMEDGYDVYFMQVPSSWGQAWTATQWKKFRDFYDAQPTITDSDKLPENVKEWPESSWKKYFYLYMVLYDKYFVYPQLSRATNFSDIGTHYLSTTEIWQVPISVDVMDIVFSDFEVSHNKYDAYFEIFPEAISLPKDIIIDLFGTKQLELFNQKFTYSVRCAKEPLQTFGSELRPLFLNIFYNVEGNDIHYAPTTSFGELTESQMETLIQNNYELGVKLGKNIGYKIGYAEGKNFILNSLPYRIGNGLLFPFKFLKKIITR